MPSDERVRTEGNHGGNGLHMDEEHDATPDCHIDVSHTHTPPVGPVESFILRWRWFIGIVFSVIGATALAVWWAGHYWAPMSDVKDIKQEQISVRGELNGVKAAQNETNIYQSIIRDEQTKLRTDWEKHNEKVDANLSEMHDFIITHQKLDKESRYTQR